MNDDAHGMQSGALDRLGARLVHDAGFDGLAGAGDRHVVESSVGTPVTVRDTVDPHPAIRLPGTDVCVAPPAGRVDGMRRRGAGYSIMERAA
jgi:hypothetical protein